MAVVVLWVGWPSVALVVVVMVVIVCIAMVPTSTVIVGCKCDIVVSIWGTASHGSRGGSSITVLN